MIRSMLEESEGKGLNQGLTPGREEGIVLGKEIQNLMNEKSVIESIYGKHDLSWLEVLKKEHINQVFTIIGLGYTYEQLKKQLTNR